MVTAAAAVCEQCYPAVLSLLAWLTRSPFPAAGDGDSVDGEEEVEDADEPQQEQEQQQQENFDAVQQPQLSLDTSALPPLKTAAGSGERVLSPSALGKRSRVEGETPVSARASQNATLSAVEIGPASI